jgi:hypothetical protein
LTPIKACNHLDRKIWEPLLVHGGKREDSAGFGM